MALNPTTGTSADAPSFSNVERAMRSLRTLEKKIPEEKLRDGMLRAAKGYVRLMSHTGKKLTDQDVMKKICKMAPAKLVAIAEMGQTRAAAMVRVACHPQLKNVPLDKVVEKIYGRDKDGTCDPKFASLRKELRRIHCKAGLRDTKTRAWLEGTIAKYGSKIALRLAQRDLHVGTYMPARESFATFRGYDKMVNHKTRLANQRHAPPA